jgi:hypothetical protein
MGWAEHVVRMRIKGKHIGSRWESQKERDNWKDLDIIWRNIFKWNLRVIGWGSMELINLA